MFTSVRFKDNVSWDILVKSAIELIFNLPSPKIWLTFAPIWFPHWPACKCTISLMVKNCWTALVWDNKCSTLFDFSKGVAASIFDSHKKSFVFFFLSQVLINCPYGKSTLFIGEFDNCGQSNKMIHSSTAGSNEWIIPFLLIRLKGQMFAYQDFVG